MDTLLGLIAIIGSLGGSVLLLGNIKSPTWIRISCGISIIFLFLAVVGLSQ